MNYEEKIERALEKVKKAEAEFKRLHAMQKNKERAKETKRKIIIGAGLLSAFEVDPDLRLIVLPALEKCLKKEDFLFVVSK
jgi:hypothetical protein